MEIDYSLDVNYEMVSQCHIVIDVRSKALADFQARGIGGSCRERSGKYWDLRKIRKY